MAKLVNMLILIRWKNHQENKPSACLSVCPSVWNCPSPWAIRWCKKLYCTI